MALTVENGTNVANADAYISEADCDAYHTAKGNSDWVGVSTDKETAIRRATDVLDGYSWQGYRTHARDQVLQWPRTSVVDREGYSIDSDEIPQELIDACAELALRELVTPGSLTPDVTIADAAKREKVGEIEVEYANSKADAQSSVPVVTVIGPLINQFLANNSGGLLSGVAHRI